MNEQLILQVLAEQQEELRKFNNKRWCNRHEERLFEWDSSMAQVVIGVRRCGKSTLCHKVLQDKKVQYGYVDMNDDRLYGLTTSDLNTVLSCIYQLYGTDIQYLFLDEIQDVEGWHLFVNRLLRQGMHVFLTGSNAKLLSSELATYLTGRYNEIHLYPFSLDEVMQYRQVDRSGLTTKQIAEQKITTQGYIIEGGMPELFNIVNSQNRRRYIGGLIEAIITKDIKRRFHIQNTDSIRRIAHHLINNSCQPINYANLTEIAGLKSIATTQKYVAYLQQAFLIHRIQKFSFKSQERMRAEKSYVVDSGFIANRDNTLIGENIGWRLENVVLIELLRRYYSEAEDIYYYKPTARSKEVDFVVCRQGLVIQLIQVAYTIADIKTFNRETQALIDAADRLRCNNLLLICMDESREEIIADKTIHIFSATDWLTQPWD